MFSRITQMNFALMDALFAQNWSTDPSYILGHFSKCRVLDTPVYFYILYFLPITFHFIHLTHGYAYPHSAFALRNVHFFKHISAYFVFKQISACFALIRIFIIHYAWLYAIHHKHRLDPIISYSLWIIAVQSGHYTPC